MKKSQTIGIMGFIGMCIIIFSPLLNIKSIDTIGFSLVGFALGYLMSRE